MTGDRRGTGKAQDLINSMGANMDDDHYKPIVKPEPYVKRAEPYFVLIGLIFTAVAAIAAALSAKDSAKQIELSAKQVEAAKDLVGLEARNNLFNELLKNYQEFCDIRATQSETTASASPRYDRVKDSENLPYTGILINYDAIDRLDKQKNLEAYMMAWQTAQKKLYNTFELIKIYTEKDKYQWMARYLPNDDHYLAVLDFEEENKIPFIARVQMHAVECIFRRTILTAIYMDVDDDGMPEHWPIIPIPQSRTEDTLAILKRWGEKDAVRILSEPNNLGFLNRLHGDVIKKKIN